MRRCDCDDATVRVRRVVTVTAVVAMAGACSGSVQTFPPTTALTTQCDSVPAGAERVTVTTADGFVMGAAAFGAAASRVGVVIAYGQGQTICDWLGIGSELA